MTYNEARIFLDSLAFHGMKLGLTNTLKLLERLGNPHRSFTAIHVGGTNGKGSTCAAIASVLAAAGVSNGLYTSPHQVSFRERIVVNGVMISREDAANLIAETRMALESEPGLVVTYFEFLTAAAFLHFARSGVRAGVIEVGLGGRFDSTNVVDPAVSVITGVAMDHMAHLGNTLEQITMEKCGIIKPGRPLVMGPCAESVAKVAMTIADERSAPLHMAGIDFSAKRVGMAENGESLDYVSPGAEYKNLLIGLRGAKQVDNAALVVTSALLLRQGGMEITDEAIRRGLVEVKIAGRFETALHTPALILDGAHNPEAAEALCRTIMERFGPGRADIVFGAMRDKDYTAMLAALAPVARSFICYSPKVPRAEDPNKLAAAQTDKRVPTRVADGVDDILRFIKTAGEGALIVVTGSFYTIGELRAAMRGAVVEKD
ncbi:MAG: bifunctional folylpolyglutamate synthase/dihydrofolate synthase [Nitrospinota bacterium]|nr:bifunctional folylpolyglutamate synthase/dihydrofolate synthase [Nitrospinota bacterium]